MQQLQWVGSSQEEIGITIGLTPKDPGFKF